MVTPSHQVLININNMGRLENTSSDYLTYLNVDHYVRYVECRADIQNLKNALYLAAHPLDSNHTERIKIALNVYNFNEMEGLDPELVEFFNDKL